MGWLKPTERRVLLELQQGAPMMRWTVHPRTNPYDTMFIVYGEKGVGATAPMSPEQAKILAECTSNKMSESNPGYVFEVQLRADDRAIYGTNHVGELIEETRRRLGIVEPPEPKYRITQENIGYGRHNDVWALQWEVDGIAYQAEYRLPGMIQATTTDGSFRTSFLPRGEAEYLQRLSELATHEDAWQIPGWPEVFTQYGIEQPTTI